VVCSDIGIEGSENWAAWSKGSTVTSALDCSRVIDALAPNLEKQDGW